MSQPDQSSGERLNVQDFFSAKFFKMESAGGILLLVAAVLAMILANSPLNGLYELLLDTPVEIRIGALDIAKPLLLWINDGLMAIFFFLVGLELKREVVQGELSDPRNIVLPGIGALGGMLVPALVYVAFNYDDPMTIEGWAIPAATDIAFAIGILSLLGSRVPVAAKVFLTSLAIFDDIGAIIIIAIFYTAKISTTALIVVAICIPVLWLMNHKGVMSRGLYVVVGIIMWVSLLKSGVHATLSGVVLAMFIPMVKDQNTGTIPLKEFEHDLHTVVAFFVLPVFAFANAGITFAGMPDGAFLHPVTVGVTLGLFLGKQAGIFAFCWLAIKLGWSRLPTDMSWISLYGVAILCGIGFTMSIFIGSLAFGEGKGVDSLFDERIGIVLGSLLSGVIGYLVLNKVLPKKA